MSGSKSSVNTRQVASRRSGSIAILAMIFKFLVASILVTSLMRMVLLIWLSDRVEATGKQIEIMLTGLRFDLMICGFLLLIPLLVLPLIGTIRKLQPLASTLMVAWLCISFAFIVLMELSTPGFIGEYDARPNILAVEYLKYPREVFATLWGGFRVPFVVACILFPLLAWWFCRYMFRHKRWTEPLWLPSAMALSLIGAFVCALAARSTLDHRPINPSTAAITSGALVNDLGLNSGYSVFTLFMRMLVMVTVLISLVKVTFKPCWHTIILLRHRMTRKTHSITSCQPILEISL